MRFGSGPPLAALGAGDAHLVTVGPAEQSNQRLLGALEQLEKRIHQLEHTAHPPPQEGGFAGLRKREPRGCPSPTETRRRLRMPRASPCCWARANPC